MGGREGEQAEQPKVPAMRSIDGKAVEGGTVLQRNLRTSRSKLHPIDGGGSGA
jgi:hypothetical protein